MEQNQTKLTVIAGRPGSGKSTKLIQDGINAILGGKSLYVMTPTHSARRSLQSAIDYQYGNELSATRKEALRKLRYSIHVLNGYALQEIILIDEMSMVSVPALFNLLYRTQYVKPTPEIHMYGDLAQLPVIKGNSVIEELIRANVEGNVWDWAKNAYENVDFTSLPAPASWHLEHDIEFKVLLENYRLQAEGFTDYNKEYFSYLLDHVIDKAEDYKQALIDAVEKMALIVSPTHNRGAQVNKMLQEHYGKSWYEVAPFVKMPKDTKVYLNPANEQLPELKKAFKFLEVLPDVNDMNKVDFTAYVVTNVAQGATVDYAVYFLGDDAIPDGKTQHHYSYNNFVVSVSRSRQATQLIGKKKSFEKMIDIVPISAQQRLQHHKSDKAINLLFENLYARNDELTADQIYQLYLNIFNDIDESNLAQADELRDYGIISTPLSKKEMILKFKDYDTMRGMAVHNNYALIYRDYIQSINKENAKGKGKVQQFIQSLTPEKLAELKADTESLSVRKFAEKYNKMAKKNVVKALSEQEVAK